MHNAQLPMTHTHTSHLRPERATEHPQCLARAAAAIRTPLIEQPLLGEVCVDLAVHHVALPVLKLLVHLRIEDRVALRAADPRV